MTVSAPKKWAKKTTNANNAMTAVCVIMLSKLLLFNAKSPMSVGVAPGSPTSPTTASTCDSTDISAWDNDPTADESGPMNSG